MNLDTTQTEKLLNICKWLLECDADLPNRDGQTTHDIVEQARDLLSLGEYGCALSPYSL